MVISYNEITNILKELRSQLQSVYKNILQIQLNPEFYNEIQNSGYVWKIKYNPLSLKEVYDYLDFFIEDFFYYNQYYYSYYKLILQKSDFNFDILTLSSKDLTTPINGQVFLKLENFPIVHVDNFVYNYTHYQFENLPSQNRTIKFQVLGKILQPTEGDFIHIHGYQFMITRVEHDLRHDLYLCTQQDVWTIEEFNSYVNNNVIRVYERLSDIKLTRVKEIKFDFLSQKQRITKDKLPKGTVRVTIQTTNKLPYDYDDVNVNTGKISNLFLEDIDKIL